MPIAEDGSDCSAALAATRAAQQASAVAHELNNILTVVRTYTQFARQATSGEQRARDLRIVAAAAERGTTLTDWLACTAEDEPYAQDRVSSKALLSAVAVRVQQLALPGTRIEPHSAGEGATFRANHARLKHVLISLALSVNQLLPGGSVRLAFERRGVEGQGASPLAPGAYVVLVVECGAATAPAPPLEIAALKEALAWQLSLFSDLMSSMGGHFALVPSQPSVARFEFSLPAVSDLPASTSGAGQRPMEHGRTILIVEDDTAIRVAMQRTLLGAGHFVLEASDGPAAQQILTELGRTVSLVVSDAVLAKGSGPELFAWLNATYPGVAFLLISGRNREGRAQASQLGVGFLGKPFYPAEFLAAATRALAAAPGKTPVRGARAVRPVVVFVDDDADIRDSFERLLSECDLETYVAKSALHALQILGERQVDAVVADQLMPGLDGIGLLDLVSERFPRCARILCTGYPGSAVVVDAVNRGRVDRVLTKTMHAVALREEIERAVLETLRARGPSDTTEPERARGDDQ